MATAYLIKKGKNKAYSLFTAFPAAFMSAVSMTYILMSNEGFGIDKKYAYPAGTAFAVILFLFFVYRLVKEPKQK